MDTQKEVFHWRHSNNNSWSCPTCPSGQLIVAPHHGSVTSIDIVSRLRLVTCQTCCLHSTCRILFEHRSLCCRSHVIGPMKISFRTRGQHLSVNRIVTQQASGQTQARSRISLMSRENRTDYIAVSRVTTLNDCRFELGPAFHVTLFIHVPQLVFEELTISFRFAVLPRTLGVDGAWSRHLQLPQGFGMHFP